MCAELAEMIVRDGGARPSWCVCMQSAIDAAEARLVAYTVAHSPLVKTALFASRSQLGAYPGRGRRAGAPGLTSTISASAWGSVYRQRWRARPRLYRGGWRAVMKQSDIEITSTSPGMPEVEVLTCDLSTTT